MDPDRGTSPPEHPRLADIAGGRFSGLLSGWSDAELLAHDFFRAAPPKGVAAEDLPVLRAYHRLLRAYPDPAAADVLYGRGFYSAHQVAAIPEHRFVREHAQALGGDDVARAVHRGARDARARARLVGAAVRDLAGSAHFKATRFYNGSAETVSYYTDVPSYQDFFGGVYYYTCPECASVLGPAAYFLDLMRIADFYVGEPNADTIPAGWSLEERRPDLFDSLLLDCENSTATQPVLVIVNEILQAHLEAALQVDDLWRDVFPTARYPFNQPFALPLVQLRATLPQLRTTLAEVWADYGAGADAVARESLQVSIEQQQDLVVPHLTPEALWSFYGWDDGADHLAEIAQLEVFLQRTGLARPQLVSLLHQDTDTQEFATVAPTFFINDTGETLPPLQLVLDDTDPDAPVERIENLTLARLDRVMRFVRLQSHLGWSYASLDWAMKSAADPDDDGDAIAQSFDALALVQRLRARLRLEPDVLAGFWYAVKPIGRVSAEHPQDLFDRTFNSPVLLAGRDPYAPSAVGVPFDPARPIDWSPAGTAGPDLEVRSRLTAALGVTDNDLTAAAAYLNCLRGEAADAVIPTTLENLSSLFRLTRLPQALGLTVGAYLTLLRAMYGPDEACVDRPAGAPRLTPLNVAAQAEVAAWLALSGWTPYDLEHAITGVLDPKVDSDFDAAGVRPFVDSLATAAESSRLTAESFVFANVDAEESARVFDGLVAEGSLTPAGVLRTPVDTAGAGVSREQLAALLPVTADTFLVGEVPPTGIPDPDAITAAEAQQTVGLLLENGVLFPLEGVPEGSAGALTEDFTAATDLSYLFPDEEDEQAAEHKRDEVRDDLLQVRQDVEHSLEVLDEAWRLQDANATGGVAQFFGVESEMAAVLVPFAAPLTDVDEVLASLLTPFPPDPLTPAEAQRLRHVEEMFRLLARLLFVLEKLGYTAEESAGVITDPAAFGVPEGDLDVAAVQSLWTFKALTAAFLDRDDRLLQYLLMPDATEAEVTAKLAELSSLTGWPKPQIATLVDTLWEEGSDAWATVFGVARLKQAFDRSAATGANVDTLLAVEALSDLPLVVDGATDPAAWTAYRNAAGTVLDLVNARYQGSERDQVNESIQDTLVTQRRNVLLPYALWTLAPVLLPAEALAAGTLPTPEDVYEYLLIDVQTSNCDRVSRIAQGVASVQLYLQRARLHLEPGVKQIPVPAVWWEWLASYGTWGANRRIFLYPENYVDPSLRRSATPVYRQLQEALLQAEVGDASVEAAYRDYLDGFATAAQLRIVGVYRNLQTDPQTGEVLDDTLFQLGRTAAEPYVYYHRALRHYAVEQDPASPGRGRTEGAWSSWAKVDVTIPAEHVTPVYAFGRLMVFWVEQQVTTGSYVQNQASQEYEVTRASIHYSFLNFRGEWAAPQTLASDIVASVEPNSYPAKLNLDEALWDPRQLWWREVAVIVVPPGGYATDAPFDNQEQLLVMYGPSLAYSPGDAIPFPDPPDPPWEEPVPARYTLNYEIYLAQSDRSYMATSLGVPPGRVPVKRVLAVAFTGIVQAQETVVVLDSLPPLPSDWPVPYSGALEGQTLVVQEYGSQIAVEYGDEAVENAWPAAPSAGAARAAQTAAPPAAPPAAAAAPEAAQATLLVNLAAVNTATTAVKNQPGWFVFDNGDDVFLAVSQQEPLYPVSTLFQASDLADDEMPPWYTYLWTYPYTTAQTPLASQRFAFTRLGTHTVDELSRLLFAGGVDALLTPAAQETKELPFGRFYPPAGQPGSVIDTTTATLDFDGAYGPYFWEVFFYTAFLAAERLSGDRRFAEAKRWYEYVFDPMAEDGSTDPDLYWRFLPFRAQTPQTLEDSLTSVAQIAAYNDDPFDPDAIARLRPGAYPRAMVLRYVQNLIDWGDVLFTQDTRETVNQATLLYVLAGDLLGKPAVNLGAFRIAVPKTYAEIRDAYDTSGTAQGGSATTIVLARDASEKDSYYNGLTVQITGGAGSGQARTVVAYAGATRTATVSTPWNTPAPAAGSTYQMLGIPQFLIEVENAPAAAENAAGLAPTDVPFVDADPYFCVPENQELTALWETIADRLFKIRHCMNIRGVERQLAQFEPPLDPRALMAGAAAGGAPPVQHAAGAAIPFYRYPVVLEQARSLAAATAQLGASLLGALQSLDAEELSLLSVTQQKALLSLTTRVYEDQLEAARWQVRVVEEGQAGAQARLDYYTALLAVGLSPAELSNLAAMEAGLVMNILAGTTRTLASVAYAVPQVGSPFAITYGGQQVGAALTAAAGVFEIGSTVAAYVAQRTATRAGYQRRAQEWELQQTLAERDLAAADDSLEAARLQVRIADRNLEVHRRTQAQNEETEAFLRRKFTSRELYQWLSSRLSSLHFQTFSLAYGAALAAQQAFQYELDSRQTFVNFGYWSAPHRGLLAGEGLLLALNQMDAAYLAGTSRPLEIERTVSLLQSNPRALLELRETGECAFELSERLFDQDFPGQYARKIKTISVSIPAVVGPYQNVKATLTQTSNQVVLGPYLDAVRYLLGAEGGAAGPQAPPPAGQLRSNWWNRQAIALSSGVNDDGMFVLSFQDPRYLPFEGTGAVSTWRLSMPKAANRFDYEALSDVVIRLSYTARDGGEAFRQGVTAIPQVKEYAAARYFDLAQQYPDAWYAFLRDHTDPAAQSLSFSIAALAPPQVADVTPSHVFVQLQVTGDADASGTYLSLAQPGSAAQPVPVGAGNHSATEPLAAKTYAGSWTLAFDLEEAPEALLTDGFLDPAKLLDVQVIVYYGGELDWGPATPAQAFRAGRR